MATDLSLRDDTRSSDVYVVQEDSRIEATLNDECDYCGFAVNEGAVLVPVGIFDGHNYSTVLCTHCSTDSTLGTCRHSRICDCSAA